MYDIRLRNFARDLIKPLKEKGIETRNFDYLKLVLKPKSKCAVFATFPASGANWTDDITGYVLAKTYKGEHGITFDQNAPTLKSAISLKYPWISPADARTLNTGSIAESFPELGLDHMFHTHGMWHESGLWGLDGAKTAMITRHIPTAIFSYSAKRRDKYKTFEECLQATGILERAIKFYNSWNKYRQKYPNNFYSFKYEDCRENPRETFSKYFEFIFDRNFDDSIISEALEYFSFEKQKEREDIFNKDENKHFHYKGKTSYKDEMSSETYNYILERLSRDLIYSFGYNYEQELQKSIKIKS